MGKIALVFSGQGAQYTGMGKEFYDNSPAGKAVFDMAEELNLAVRDVNDTYKEILIEGAYLVIVKITSFNKYEQGVDFNISTKWLLDLGRGKTLVTRLYNTISKYAKFKGVSLHP